RRVGGAASCKLSDGWDRQPIFYCSNMLRLFGPDEEVPYPSATNDLDDELKQCRAVRSATRRATMAWVAELDIDKEDQEMKRSTDRMLTTHAGSLPRLSDLDAMLRAKEAGQPYDAQTLQQRLARAVAETVQQQAEHGLDIISDGEQSKTSFT